MVDPAQSFDVGLDYNDALTLQLTRRTAVSFGAALGSARAFPGSTQYRILGNAGITHFLGRTWSTTASFSRNLGFVAAFDQPVLSDLAMGTLSGQLATRVFWSSVASWSRGYVGLDQSKHFDSQFATSLLDFAVSRHITAFIQYAYFQNRLPPGLLALSTISTLNRQTASVGLSLFVPIFNTQRTP